MVDRQRRKLCNPCTMAFTHAQWHLERDGVRSTCTQKGMRDKMGDVFAHGQQHITLEALPCMRKGVLFGGVGWGWAPPGHRNNWQRFSPAANIMNYFELLCRIPRHQSQLNPSSTPLHSSCKMAYTKKQNGFPEAPGSVPGAWFLAAAGSLPAAPRCLLRVTTSAGFHFRGRP